LTQKILNGEKIVETRWYMSKYKPWGQIKEGDIVYFKDSGKPVTVKAVISKVEQYSGLDENIRKKILKKYTQKDLGITEIESEIVQYVNNKRYCIVIHLKNPKKVKPFKIDKRGYGAMASWLIVDDINKIKIKQVN